MTSETYKIEEIGNGSLVNLTLGNSTIDQRTGNKILTNNIFGIDEKTLVAFSNRAAAEKAMRNESGIILADKALGQASIFSVI